MKAWEVDKLAVLRRTLRLLWKITYKRWCRFTELIKAALAIQANEWAISRIEKLSQQFLRDHQIDCNFKRVEGYLFQGGADSKHDLQKMHQAYLACGRSEVDFVERVPVLGDVRCGLRFPEQGQFHPLQYLDALSKTVQALGGAIRTRSRVIKVNAKNEDAEIALEDGSLIRARNVVIAANSPFNDRFVMHTKQSAYRTYAIAFELNPNTLADVPLSLLWDTEDPYHYIRFQDEFVIVGGEDHRTGQNSGDESEAFTQLIEWTRAHLPLAILSLSTEPRYRWSGQILESVDHLPFIGRNPNDSPNVYIVTGMAGQGMTYSIVASKLISDLIQGQPNPWEKVFLPSRILSGGIKEFALENSNTASQYRDWFTAGEAPSLKNLKDDEGVVIRDGLQKIAVYRDSEGKVHRCSAVCPHLYALVRWNALEKTWDCPCHGSRFDPYGIVIEGPAVGDLSKR